MAQYPSFNEHYRPQIQNQLNQNVDHMERKINEAQQLKDADEAERMLDEACDKCLENVQEHVNGIKASIKQKRPSSSASSQEQKRYTDFVAASATGVNQTKGLFDTIFARIRNMINTVVEWIRKGLAWMASRIVDTFKIIRSLFQ